MTVGDAIKYVFELAYQKWIVTALFLWIIAWGFASGGKNE